MKHVAIWRTDGFYRQADNLTIKGNRKRSKKIDANVRSVPRVQAEFTANFRTVCDVESR